MDNQVAYNPYEPIRVFINGQEVFARPYEFDSEMVDTENFKNGFGKLVKPIKLSTSCPNCGQGIFLQVVFDDPPFMPIRSTCPHCRPEPEPMPDPFINPYDAGRLGAIDPELTDQLIPAAEQPAQSPELQQLLGVLDQKSPPPKKTKPKKTKPKKPKKTEAAEDLKPQKFDDSSFLE